MLKEESDAEVITICQGTFIHKFSGLGTSGGVN